ncbi:hypothetical protein JAAARDRAFT_32995 [Jaapia argillacea MUCL 33604]|uniref:CS domain-containing protein n=1 Tax=Jaapia argillacea MUCL 33604 TaxID=933084 RepID=A0A067Q7I4_9AGAM|nr:hypothetical protein JAAARDRAFT_32995 [Jaapia argillacea MUCL 33604]
MITPRFSCNQTDTSVTVRMYCPSVRASDVEINVDETLFTIHINPYFLRLNFPGRILEDDKSSAQYDPSSGYLTVSLTKEVKGEEFKDLDLLAKLLAPRPSKDQPSQPMIEVLDSESTSDDGEEDLVNRTNQLNLDSEQQTILEAAENDWQLPQSVPDPLPALHTSLQKPYGFLDMYTGYFAHVEHTENEVNELGSLADTLSIDQRRKMRLKHEEEKWDEEYYMADFADDSYIRELIAWRHPHALIDAQDPFNYTEEEKAAMLRLPRKEYLATPVQTHNLYLTLLTLLFSYAYDSRTTQQDPTPESAWTICSLTPAFSALDPPPYATSPLPRSPSEFSCAELSAVFTTVYRRALAFGLYRSWKLAEKCRTDVADFLSKGKRLVTRCLLEMKHILDHHEVYYVYSKVWTDDFCVWVQAYASDDVLRDLAERIRALKLDKESTGWDLEESEEAVQGELERDSDSDDESADEVERMAAEPL